jgi:restriction system protein
MDYFTKRKYSKPFTVDEKKNYSQKMKESKIKGDNYEIYVAEHYKSIGYEVSLNGIIHGKKDNGIDIICNKNNELILIQCKNWKENSKYKVTHLILKAFIGCCSEYIIKIESLTTKVIRFLLHGMITRI